MSNRYPSNPNKRGHRLKRAATAAAFIALAAVGVEAAAKGINAYNEAEAKKNAETSAQIGQVIEPKIDQLGADALAAYQRQEKSGAAAKDKNIHLRVDPEKGTATITGYVDRPSVIDGKVVDRTEESLEVVTGLKEDGTPDVTDTRYFFLQQERNSSERRSLTKLQFSAPGAEGYKFNDFGESYAGWSAYRSGVTDFGEFHTNGSIDTDSRRGPYAQSAMESARSVVEDADTIADYALKVLAPTDAAK